MNRGLSTALAVVTGLACAAPVRAQLTPRLGEPVPQTREILSVAQIRLDQLGNELAEAARQCELAEARYKSGTAPESEVSAARRQLEAARANYAVAKVQWTRLERLAAFQRPVDVDLKDATLRQTAETMSQVAGFPIRVDAGTPGDLRINAVARGVSLGTILEAIARQSNLMIAPGAGDGGGVNLRNWPTLTVNGRLEVFSGPFAPWSNDWDTIPTAAQYFLSRAAAPPQMATPATVVPPQVQDTQVPSPMATVETPYLVTPPPGGLTSVRSGIGSASRLGMTSLGDHMLVLAEPGSGPHGEAGIWLTVYRLDGTQLRKISATFHNSRTSSARPVPGSGLGGMPGMPGSTGLPGGGGYGGGLPTPPLGGGSEGGGAPPVPGTGGGVGSGGPAAPVPAKPVPPVPGKGRKSLATPVAPGRVPPPRDTVQPAPPAGVSKPTAPPPLPQPATR